MTPPVRGRKLTAAAQQAGLSASSMPALRVEGDNKSGLALRIAQAIADAGVELSFFVAQAIGRRYAAIIGFETDTDAKKAAALIKKAAANKKKKARKSTGFDAMRRARRARQSLL